MRSIHILTFRGGHSAAPGSAALAPGRPFRRVVSFQRSPSLTPTGIPIIPTYDSTAYVVCGTAWLMNERDYVLCWY